MGPRQAFALLLSGAAIAAAGCRIQPIQDSEVVAEPAVVSVIARHGRHGHAGTGFAISPTRIVTARHVIEGQHDIYIRLADRRQVAAKFVVAESEEHDIAVLEIEETPGLPHLAWSFAAPRADGVYRCVSTQEGHAQTVTPVTSAGPERRTETWGITTVWRGELGDGASGAPVLDEHGNVLGVVVGGEMDAVGDPWSAVPARIVAAIHEGPRWSQTAWAEKTKPGPGTEARDVLQEAGRAYLDQRYADALASLEKGLPKLVAVPEYADEGLVRIAQCLQALNRSGEVEARLRQAVTEHPDRAWSHRALARFLYGADRKTESLDEMREILKIEDDLELRLWVAARLLQLRRFAEAESEARIAVARHPDSATANDLLARALGEQYRSAEAERALRVTARRHANLGVALCRLGKVEDGRAELEEAVRIEPRFAGAHEGLARLHWQLGDSEAAKKEIEILRGLDAEGAAALEKEFAEAKAPSPR